MVIEVCDDLESCHNVCCLHVLGHRELKENAEKPGKRVSA